MKKLILFGGIALLLLGGAGGGLYMTGMLDSLLGKKPADAEAAEKDDGHGDAAAHEAVFVPMEPLAAPIIVGNRVRSQVLLTLSLQVPDMKARNDALSVMPRLRDAMLQDLYDAPVVRHDEDGAIDIATVKVRLLEVAHRVLGPETVRDVLVIKAVQIS